jgi:hypothetical protein
LVVGIVVQLVEASGQTEIGELDMTATVKQNIVGFDVTDIELVDLCRV